MPNWVIREIREHDIGDIAALERDIFSDPWTESGIRETLRQENTVLLGAWKNDIMSGYVILYYVLNEGEIARIAVGRSDRRQGCADYLFGRLRDICGRKGITRMMLEVRESNAAAVSFYKKCGFTEDGVRKKYYSNPCEDAILMSVETDGRFDSSSHWKVSCEKDIM